MNFNKFFNTLANNGFTIEEFKSIDGVNNNYIAIYYNSKNALAVITSNKDNYHLKALDALNYLKSKGINEVYINNVIQVESEVIEKGDFYGTITVNIYTGELISARGASEWVINTLKNISTPKTLKEKIKEKNLFTVTNAIIIINIIIFIISAILSRDLLNINIYVLVALGAKFNYFINQGEYYRLFTCMFLHGGLMHIVFNMYALKSIGHLTENIYGKLKFSIIYIISGIIGSYFSYKLSDGIAVGASGAIFGLLGAALVFAYNEKHRIGKEFLVEILKVIGINIFIGLTLPNIDNYAHLGGLLAGIISSFVIYPMIKKSN